MHVWVYEHLTHVCEWVHTCLCAYMRVCTFDDPPPSSIEVGLAGFVSPNPPPPPPMFKSFLRL